MTMRGRARRDVTRGRETRGGSASACVFYLFNLTFGSRGTNRPSVRGGGKRKFVDAGDDGTRLSERAFFLCFEILNDDDDDDGTRARAWEVL